MLIARQTISPYLLGLRISPFVQQTVALILGEVLQILVETRVLLSTLDAVKLRDTNQAKAVVGQSFESWQCDTASVCNEPTHPPSGTHPPTNKLFECALTLEECPFLCVPSISCQNCCSVLQSDVWNCVALFAIFCFSQKIPSELTGFSPHSNFKAMF